MMRLAPLLFLLTLTGCESPRSSVHGTVTFRGQPLSDASIVFIGSDNQSYPSYPKADGTYEVSGLPRGKVKVSVTVNPPRVTDGRPQPGVEPGRRDLPEAREDDARKMRTARPAAAGNETLLPPHYADPEQSGLDFELTEPNQKVDLVLK